VCFTSRWRWVFIPECIDNVLGRPLPITVGTTVAGSRVGVAWPVETWLGNSLISRHSGERSGGGGSKWRFPNNEFLVLSLSLNPIYLDFHLSSRARGSGGLCQLLEYFSWRFLHRGVPFSRGTLAVWPRRNKMSGYNIFFIDPLRTWYVLRRGCNLNNTEAPVPSSAILL